MKIHFFKNSSNRFIDVSDKLGFKETVGWWNSIKSIDIDKDGDNDYLVGNLGLNYKYKTSDKEPFEIYSNDFDVNGKLDIVLGYGENGKTYPVNGFDDAVRQLPVLKLRYKGYEEFARATLQEIYGDQMLQSSLHYAANTFASYWIENKGNGEFEMHKLPNRAQFSSINDMVEIKYKENKTAFIIAGNLYGSEVETPRDDASVGLVLVSDAKGEINVVPPDVSTLMIKGEVKNIRKLRLASGNDAFLFAINSDSLKLIESNFNHK
jgi:enediyne biosynthesis protein E4